MKNFFQEHVVHRKSHMDVPVIPHGLTFSTPCRGKTSLSSARRPDRRGAHPASYFASTRVSILWIKVAGAWSRSLYSSAEIKNTCSFATTHPYTFIAWYFIKHRDKITLKFHAYRHFFLLWYNF